MRLPDDSSQRDTSARRLSQWLPLLQSLPPTPSAVTEGPTINAGERGRGVHIGFKAPIFNSYCNNKEKLTVFSCSFICCLWLFLRTVVVVVTGGAGVQAVFLCKQGRVRTARRRCGATGSRRTRLNLNARGHCEDGATGAL